MVDFSATSSVFVNLPHKIFLRKYHHPNIYSFAPKCFLEEHPHVQISTPKIPGSNPANGIFTGVEVTPIFPSGYPRMSTAMSRHANVATPIRSIWAPISEAGPTVADLKQNEGMLEFLTTAAPEASKEDREKREKVVRENSKNFQ